MSTIKDAAAVMKPDGLAEKLHAQWRGSHAMGNEFWPSWEQLHDEERAAWESIAVLARGETMRGVASTFEALLKISFGDADAAPYVAGIRFMINALRGAAS